MKRGDGFYTRDDAPEQLDEDLPALESHPHAQDAVIVEGESLVTRAVAWLAYGLGDSHVAAAHIADELVQYLKPGANRTPVSPGKRRQVFERDAYRCVECDSWKGLEVDHIIPVTKGGTNAIRNLQTLCHDCNVAKGNRV